MATSIVRVGDPHAHGGTVLEGSPNVFANGRPVARVGDAAWCNLHRLQRVATGSAAVFANGKSVARAGDTLTCGAQLLSDSDVLVGG